MELLLLMLLTVVTLAPATEVLAEPGDNDTQCGMNYNKIFCMQSVGKFLHRVYYSPYIFQKLSILTVVTFPQSLYTEGI